MTILVTGGAGFIGSNFVLDWCESSDEPVINLDKLTYAGNRRNLAILEGSGKYIFVHGDICDSTLLSRVLVEYGIRAIVHFAAESHVDRSIHGPTDFIDTNVVGTFRLLECARMHWLQLDAEQRERFRFLHVSTDEVYGSLEPDAPAFSESNRYEPNSPYAATKAAADHLARAWYRTYELPVITTNCSNNYGPFQFPEKLIPLFIHNALAGRPLPMYGDGQQVRDWLYVRDHCSAIRTVLESGRIGETYNIGGCGERNNLEVAQTLCAVLDELSPRGMRRGYAALITFVKDRPGHDRRYAIDCSKLQSELHWRPEETFDTGIRKTVQWYLDHAAWVSEVTSGAYRKWVTSHYGA